MKSAGMARAPGMTLTFSALAGESNDLQKDAFDGKTKGRDYRAFRAYLSALTALSTLDRDSPARPQAEISSNSDYVVVAGPMDGAPIQAPDEAGGPGLLNLVPVPVTPSSQKAASIVGKHQAVPPDAGRTASSKKGDEATIILKFIFMTVFGEALASLAPLLYRVLVGHEAH